MAISVGDVIRIQTCQELFSQRLCNIFYYIVAAWTGNATITDLLTPFGSTVVLPMLTMQTDDLTHVQYRADNITNGLDFAELDLSAVGTYPGSETQAPFIAAGFTLTRTTKLTRPGAKRVAGISEAICNDGVIDPLAALFIPVIAGFSAPLVINTPNVGDGLLSPVIVGRDSLGAYDLTRLNPITGAVVNSNVTSQNTRKVGR